MRSDAWAIALVAAWGCACSAPGPAWTTVELALAPVPERVRSITITVVDLEAQEVVSTTTAAPDTQSFALGVPAERPLELRVVARTDRPGPLALGGVMPAYVARARRTVRLGREQQRIGLIAEPAGVLTFGFVGRLADPIVLRFRDRESRAVVAELPIGSGRVGNLSVVLPTGELTSEVAYDEGIDPTEEPRLEGGAGLYVGREAESIAALEVVEPDGVLPEEAPRTLALELRDLQGVVAPGAIIRTASVGPTRVQVTVTALDGRGRPVADDRARVSLHLSFPGLDDPPKEARGLPATFERNLLGSGRMRVWVTADLEERRGLRVERELNFLAPGLTLGTPNALELEVDDEDALRAGARLLLRVLDRQGFLVRPTGLAVDLSDSDPWVIFPDGGRFTIPAEEESVYRTRLVRSSGPQRLPVRVRAVATSSLTPTLSSTLTLPILELPRR